MSIQRGQLAYFAEDTKVFEPIKAAHHFKEKYDEVALLWGDEVYVFDIVGKTALVSGKRHHLRIPLSMLMPNPILSVYQIDCGQGDSALIHFPDGRWMMVDGGPARDWSNSGKIGPDFLSWKMFQDQSWKNEFNFRRRPFFMDAVVCTHPDYDHFGGFMEMTDWIAAAHPTMQFGTVFHCGLGRFGGVADTKFENGEGFGQLGPLAGTTLPDAYMTTLIDDFADVRKYSRGAGARKWKLAGKYADWLTSLESLEGKGVGALARVDHSMGHLPGFGQGSAAPVTILGPVTESWKSKPALRYLDTAGMGSMGDPSRTRNGQSVVLRIDYDQVRILLTGDLNFRSQALLLDNIPATEFRCHVAKACHHGSEDLSWKFAQAMGPLATMFSSGDNETYAHPRAKALGLTAAFGTVRHRGSKQRFLGLEEERFVAPLIYSTELSRSVALYPPHAVFDNQGDRVIAPELQAEGRTAPAGGKRLKLDNWWLADQVAFGLINVRTDGKKILMAVQKEGDASFQTETLHP